jgi:hypothetical protein
MLSVSWYFSSFQWIVKMGRESLWALTGENVHQTVCINIVVMNAFIVLS